MKAAVMKPSIRLRGMSGEVKGKQWESDALLRAGRLVNFEICLEDNSVSRKHAEVRRAESGWWVRDLDSTNGTYVNGVRLGAGERQLHARDIVQFGKVAMMVEVAELGGGVSDGAPLEGAALSSSDQILVEASAKSSWEDGFQRLVHDRNNSPRAGEQLVALLRAGHHFITAENEDALLHAILNDSVAVLDSQRGAIVLADATGDPASLRLRALATGKGEAPGRFHFSKKLAQRCFGRGESILCTSVEDDAELKGALSIADGAMASVLCVLLRTPRKRLGVLHLDRSYWQKPFTEDDLHLADALAAHVSAGIESATLLRKQREMFVNTIMVLAQAVEMRDEYTAGHTMRVTHYSMLLAEKMKLGPADLELIRTGGPLHDIGKIGISDAILRKPGKLTDEEFVEMKTHTVRGSEIISLIPDLLPIHAIVRNHHERWDGRGYPDKLAGENIPLLARIVSVADAFDAMTSNRPYHPDQKGMPPEYAFSEVQAKAGSQFDPQCAQAFLEIEQEIRNSMSIHRKSGLANSINQWRFDGQSRI